MVHITADNWLNRRTGNGELKGFPQKFFELRDEALRELLIDTLQNKELPLEMLVNKRMADFDERIIEYPVALLEILRAKKKEGFQLLDIGCVLNHKVFSEIIKGLNNSIWFLNPAVEKLHYSDNVAYIMNDIRTPNLPKELCFDLVTCLSTIEHVGMDNTRYGGSPPEFISPPADPERFAGDAVQAAFELVRPGGTLLISVPFGPFEYLYKYGIPNLPIYYTFDIARVNYLSSLVDGQKDISIFKVIPCNGWIQTDINDTDILSHACNCASAGGVCFLKIVKPN